MKKSISIVAVAALMLPLAMAAPAMGAIVWNGSVGDGLWNTPGNWTGSSGGRDILNGDTVTLSGAAGSSGSLEVKGGSTLTVTTDLDSSDDLLMDTGGTFNMNAGYYEQGEKFKLNEGGAATGGATFNMNGGKLTVGNKLEIYNNAVLDISGGNLAANDGDGIEFVGGTVRVNGIWTGLVGEDLIYLEAVTESGGTFEFLPNAAGEIATIMTSTTGVASNALKVILDAGQTAATTLTLFDGGAVGAFSSVEVTQGVTTLTEGTWNALGVNEYAIDYVSDTGAQMQVNVVPEPATMSLLAIGGLALIRRRKRA